MYTSRCKTSIDINPMEIIRKYGLWFAVGAVSIGLMIAFYYKTYGMSDEMTNSTVATATQSLDSAQALSTGVTDAVATDIGLDV